MNKSFPYSCMCGYKEFTMGPWLLIALDSATGYKIYSVPEEDETSNW